jgi:hypothetical protein
MEQRVNFKFSVKLQKCRRATLEMYKTVYGESAMRKNNVFLVWHKRFRKGREYVNDETNGRKCRENQGTCAV